MSQQQPNRNLPVERQTREVTQIDALKNNLMRRADEFRMVLPSHITPEKFQRVIATAALQNRILLTCDRQSLLMAAMKLAQDGLLPDGREAALVPFKQWNKETRTETWLVQPMPMVYGLRKKILQSGQVVSLETHVVYRAELEGGNFLYEIGIEPPIRHRPKLDMTEEQTHDDNIIAAYSIARIQPKDGSIPYWSVEVMSRVEINKVRQTSQTGALGRTVKGGKNAGQPIDPKGPWVDWFGEMARKTVMRRHSKVLPMSGDIIETFERDIEAERAADSAAAYLAVEPDAPKILPSNDEGEGEGEPSDTGEVVDHDPDTGEVREGSSDPADDDAAFADGIIKRAARIETIIDLNGIESEWKDRAYMIDDDAICASVQREIDAARNRLAPAK